MARVSYQGISTQNPPQSTSPGMNPKKRPNHRLYLQVLRSMTPEERLLKAFELSTLGKALFIEGLRKRFPDVSAEEFRKILLSRLAKCHNRNY